MKLKLRSFSVLSLIISFCTFFGSSPAQPKDIKVASEKSKYIGVVLVIGNSDYKHATVLNSPVNDAVDMGNTLEGLAFKVLNVKRNATLQEMENAVAEFGRELSANGGIGVFYYSGHGVQSKGSNYLIPTDAVIANQSLLKYKALNLNAVLATMEDSTNKSKIIILDACRNNPFEKSWRTKGISTDGLAQVNAPRGTLIAYATSPDDVAADGNGRNSPYTEVLLKEIKTPGISIGEMFQTVRFKLHNITKGNQIPWESTSLIGRYCFGGCTKLNFTENSLKLNGEHVFWQASDKRETIAAYEAYISNYLDGEFVPLANFKIREIKVKAKSFFEQAKKLGSFFHKLDDLRKAVKYYSNAIEIYPNYEFAYLNRGFVYYKLKDFNKSIADFNKVIEINSQNASAYYNRGSIHYKNHNYHQALQDINKSFEIANKRYISFDDYLLRGQIYNKLDKYDLAIGEFKKSLELSVGGTSDFVYSERGITHLSNKKYELAIKDFTKVLQDMIGHNQSRTGYFRIVKSEIYNYRGEAYLGSRTYDSAIADFTKAIESLWGFSEAYENRAFAYEAIGNYKLAKLDREKVQELKK